MNARSTSPHAATESVVAMIGMGMIGQAWAVVFAQAGFSVAAWDPDTSASSGAFDAMAAKLDNLRRHDLVTEQPERVLARIHVVADLEAAVRGACYVQENGPERLAVRQALFARLDAATPADVPIASSTSGMRPSRFTASLAGRARCLVAHPANPPSLLPLVEICPAPWTSRETIDAAACILRRAGRQIATLKREADGFVLNRLQGALLAEAFRLVADDVVDVDDVDTVMTQALGLRWSFMGPFETIDLNAPGGIADFCERYGALYDALQAQMTPRLWDETLIQKVAHARRERLALDDLAERQAWRDRRLTALTAFNAAQRETEYE